MADGIRFLAMDVDGTLTDGRLYFGPDGEAMKAFDAKDGYAIKCMLPELGIVPVVITARECAMLERRCAELGVEELHQGVADKAGVLATVLRRRSAEDGHRYTLRDVAYIGDDIPDLQCMRAVGEAGGIVGCPSDAVAAVREAAGYVCGRPGGWGAVREFVEHLGKARGLH